MRRAWATLSLKAVDPAQRIIEGTASTPELDRQGDRMDPEGAQFALPLPLLWQHDSHHPIGQVLAAAVSPTGIRIRAQIAAGVLPFIDDAYALIKAGLVRGLSIGWRPLAEPVQTKGVWTWPKWEWLELSAVTVPANQSASIALVKSLDHSWPIPVAALGTAGHRPRPRPGVSGVPRETTMKISEELTSERDVLAIKSARLEALITKAQTDGGLEDDETTEQTTLEADIASGTARVKTLTTLEAAHAAQAAGVGYTPPMSTTVPRGRVELPELPKGTRFTRYAMAVAAGKGSWSDTLAYAKRFTNTPEVYAFVKAQSGTAVVGSPAWGGELVNPNTLSTEFVELLRPMTIIGRVDGFRRVPFNIPIITQTGGSTISWVGEQGPKPVGELDFTRTTLTWSKVAGIIVLTDELIRLSTPSAEATVRQDLLDQSAKFLDEQFIRVAVTAGPNNPASITNGVATTPATGTDYTALLKDLNVALGTFDTNNIPSDGLTIVTTPALGRGISTIMTPLGVRAFDGMTPTGGTLIGYPVIVSAAVDSGKVVLFKSSEVFLADDGQVTLDASNQATLDMAGGSSPTFNLWQKNCVGIRAERWIRWQKRRAGVVAVITGATYGA
jgi:HK97 family phage major capsid protein/HK97 family phage prohead protease